MAERGKTEESQRTEVPPAWVRDGLPARVRAGLQDVASHLEDVFGPSTTWNVSYEARDDKTQEITIVVGGHLAEASERSKKSSSARALPEPPEPRSEPRVSDVVVERDDAYYDEVRQAVGRGAPSVLLGTSTKALARSLQKLKTVQQADIDPPSSTSPEPADLTDVLRQSVKVVRDHPKKD